MFFYACMSVFASVFFIHFTCAYMFCMYVCVIYTMLKCLEIDIRDWLEKYLTKLKAVKLRYVVNSWSHWLLALATFFYRCRLSGSGARDYCNQWLKTSGELTRLPSQWCRCTHFLYSFRSWIPAFLQIYISTLSFRTMFSMFGFSHYNYCYIISIALPFIWLYLSHRVCMMWQTELTYVLSRLYIDDDCLTDQMEVIRVGSSFFYRNIECFNRYAGEGKEKKN